MPKRRGSSSWAAPLQRVVRKIARRTLQSSVRAYTDGVTRAVKKTATRREAAAGTGQWLSGIAIGPAGMRRYRLFIPAATRRTAKLPLLVMLHGCQQDADTFALGTAMNRLAAREGFAVLYPEQDRIANPQGCWNWYETRSGRAQREAASVLAAIDQVCLLYPLDSDRVALAGLSAGASLAALLATLYPARFKAIAMHSGIAPGIADSTISALRAMHGRGHASLPDETVAWPPLLVIQGKLDMIVAASNGRSAAALWAEAHEARPAASREVQRGQRHGMTVTDFKSRGRLVAQLCEVQGLRHGWSGGKAGHPYTDPQGPDASRLIWTFATRRFAGR